MSRNVAVAVVLFLLVDGWRQCAADEPADHQRKIHGRMLWPSSKQQPNDAAAANTFSRQMIIRFPKTGSLLDESFPSGERQQQQPLRQRNDEEGGADYASIMDAGSNGFLTFSLAASDAEGAEGYYPRAAAGSSASDINEQMHNKLDLLNQLLRLAPDADATSKSEQQEGNHDHVDGGGYDKCNHPFHSWMCTKKGEAPQQKRPAVPSAPAPPAVIVEPFPDAASVISEVQSTVRPTEKASNGWEGADPCTHPFHSWLCGESNKVKPKLKSPEESPRPDASVFGDNLLPPPATSTTVAPPPPTTTFTPPVAAAGSWDGADPCTHPFHSWLCNRSPSAKPKVPTKAPPPPPVIVPDASIIDDTFFIPEAIPTPSPSPKPTTTPTPSSTTEASILIRTMMPKGGWDEADSCSHPFHSWLCAKPKPKSTTTTTTTTTTPPPPPPPVEEIVFEPEPAPSIESDNNQLIPDAEPPPPPIKSGWDEADSCSHPFHSWLCAKPKTVSTTPPPTPPPPPPPPAKVEEEILPFPDASNQVPEPAPEPTPTRTAKTNKGSWDGADPCTHPLHSWLCNRAAKPAASPRTATGRKLVRSSGRSISSETELTDEETIRGLENFESLRLSPPIGRRVRNSDGIIKDA